LWQNCLQDFMWKEENKEVKNKNFLFHEHSPGMNIYEKLGFIRTNMNWHISDQREYNNYFRVHQVIKFITVRFLHIAIW
jgi:hypothetical protein